MMSKLTRMICAVALCTCAAVAQATVLREPVFKQFTLDFDTPATGSTLIQEPLLLDVGTIVATAPRGSFCVCGGQGLTGNGLAHDLNGVIAGPTTNYAQLAFDFDVAAITFVYQGWSGSLQATIYDAAMNALGQFYDPDTSTDFPGGPVTLTGSGIRIFRFADTLSEMSAIDNVFIKVAVPEPGVTALLVLAMIGAGVAGRRRE